MGLTPSNADVNERVSNSCNKRFLLYDAIENFKICSQPYLNETQSKILTQSSNIVKNIAELSCENNGLTLVKLRTYDIDSCREKLEKPLKSCVLPYENQIAGLRSLYSFLNYINEKQCDSINDVTSFTDCVVRELRTSCSDFLAIVYQKIFEIIHNESKCATETE